jgi:hypothetical protein
MHALCRGVVTVAAIDPDIFIAGFRMFSFVNV